MAITADTPLQIKICLSEADLEEVREHHQSNVQNAITTVRPYGLDLCSSVRSKGRLDPRLLEDFIDTAVRSFSHSDSTRC